MQENRFDRTRSLPRAESHARLADTRPAVSALAGFTGVTLQVNPTACHMEKRVSFGKRVRVYRGDLHGR